MFKRSNYLQKGQIKASPNDIKTGNKHTFTQPFLPHNHYVDTQTHTDRRTDRKVKTEGSKILSNDIFYFKTVIIGGPIKGYNENW